MTLHLVIASEFAAERTSCGPERHVVSRGFRIRNQKRTLCLSALLFTFVHFCFWIRGKIRSESYKRDRQEKKDWIGGRRKRRKKSG